MPTFTIASTVSVDGTSVRSNTNTLEVQSFMDYTKEVTTTYSALVTGDDQPTPMYQVILHNTGLEPAIVRCFVSGADYIFTGLPAGATMICPLRELTAGIFNVAARGENGTATIRVIALYI